MFAVSFDALPLPVVDMASFGLEHLGAEFPVRQEQPPTQMPIETFDNKIQNLAPALSLLTGAPPIRLWFQSEDRTRLVQVQRDWVAYNWQRASSDGPYPRYKTIESSFLEIWDKLASFVAAKDFPPLKVRQCELTYINHIFPADLWQRPGQLGNVIRLVGEAGNFLPEPEDGQLAFRYRIPHEGRDVGRLYVQAAPAQNRDDLSPVIKLDIIARGEPIGEGREGVRGFFRLARNWMTNGFAAVTTDDAQNKLWERTR